MCSGTENYNTPFSRIYPNNENELLLHVEHLDHLAELTGQTGPASFAMDRS